MIRKRRVTKTVILLTLTFIVLWFPVHFLTTWYRLDKNFPQDAGWFILKMIAHTMTYANSSMNPLIYAFSNDSVRHSFLNMFKVKKGKNEPLETADNQGDFGPNDQKGEEMSGLFSQN